MNDIEKAQITQTLAAYNAGTGHIIYPVQEAEIFPETREISGKTYHKKPDGMWYGGKGTAKKGTQNAIPKELVGLAVSTTAKAWDTRFIIANVLEAFRLNTLSETNHRAFCDKFINCQTKKEMIKCLLQHDIQVRCFNGKEYIGILKKPTPVLNKSNQDDMEPE